MCPEELKKMKDDIIIELRNVSKTLKGKKILDNISVSFEKGKIYGIVGPNASGKTMLLRAIAKLLYLSEGEVLYTPKNISIGIIVENPGFLLSYTGFENLKILAQIKNLITTEEIKGAMIEVGLEPNDTRKVKEYSLGMKQKLALAQAMMERPQVIILDEPTRGLDEESVINIRQLLLRKNQDGATILISSHNPGDIEEMCNTVLRIENGRIKIEA